MSFGRGLLYIASAAGLALLARSLLLEPVPLWVAVVALVSYALIALAGVLEPRLQMYAPVLWRGPSNQPEIALTFDDGPHPVHTREVLRLLAQYEVRATFFVIGKKVDAHPDVLREIVAAGHEIGIHGYEHDRLHTLRTPSTIIADASLALDRVEAITGQRPALFRPPVGHISPRTETAARKLGLVLVTWSVSGRDGLASANAHKVAMRVRRGLRPGAIVALHDAAERSDRKPAGVAALPAVLEAVQAQRLQVVPVAKFAAAKAPQQ